MIKSRVAPGVLCRCQRTNLNLALDVLNLVDPHMKDATPDISSQECLAETQPCALSATCTFNPVLFLPWKYAAKHLFILKSLVRACMQTVF